jgi:Tol biopolymer transport system component
LDFDPNLRDLRKYTPGYRNSQHYFRPFPLLVHPGRLAWSPDGSHVVFSSSRDGGVSNLYRKVASGSGNEELLFKSEEAKYAQDWSPGGKFLLYSIGGMGAGS